MLDLKIRRPLTIREKVFKSLRDDIFNGRIASGTRLVEARLARDIKTSRTPVREALHLLEMEGLLEVIPRVGYRVKQIKPEEVAEICEIRAVNETLAAHWAMKRISPGEVQALEKNLSAAEREVKGGKPKAFVERDAEFHEILVKASGSTRLFELCQLLRRHMLRYRIESLYLEETALRGINGHRRIFQCLIEKDEQNIEAVIRAHLEQSKRDILRYAFDLG